MYRKIFYYLGVVALLAGCESGTGISHSGGIDITIKLPPAYGLVIRSVEAVFVDTGKDAGSTELTGDTVSYKKEGIAAGYYLISFKLKDTDNVVRATVTEMVRVVNGLTSSKTAALESKDFSHVISGTTLVEKLDWLTTNALTGNSYTILVSEDETINPQTLTYSGKTNITITLTGGKTMQTISLSATNGSLFTIPGGVTLIMDNNITLKGRAANGSYSVVTVNEGGFLLMNEGSKITGNGGSASGSGVKVSKGGFTMTGGEISGNTTTSGGGGVYVDQGTFIMSGGEISDNSTTNTSGGGGGVRLVSSTATTPPSVFTMTGGKISNNTTNYWGGGVYADNLSKFTMTGGEISGNKSLGASYGSGGGVYISTGTATAGAVFTMYNGKILNNIAEGTSGNNARGGGGVCIGGTPTSTYLAVFTMYNGEISGNTSGAYGGGVSVLPGRQFIMHNGKISGNTSGTDGGGVYNAGTFRIVNNGVIYGSDAAAGLKNTATNDGAALFVTDGGTAEYGYTANDGSFIQSGDLSTTGYTVEVKEGDLE